MIDQMCVFEDEPEYDAFVEKFKQKKTTDDCYTPPLIYDTIRDWTCRQYKIDPGSIVRPFYPGGDYERFKYPEGCVVLDNPPFSILSKICEFYLDRDISFFLFAPSLTVFSGRNVVMRVNHIICDADIKYENGAVVRTSFVTNLDKDIIAQTAPNLTRLINEAVDTLYNTKTKSQQKYDYPDAILTAAMLQKYSKYGVYWEIRRNECVPISKLDAQRAEKKNIFGGGLLLSEQQSKLHAEVKRTVAERAAAHIWRLSPRETELVKKIGRFDA